MLRSAQAPDPVTAGAIEATLLQERHKLVGLCARITGNRDVAEDLVQDTMIEAWRHQHTLRHKDQVSAWLAGIARNVCRRWLRSQGYVAARQIEPIGADEGIPADHIDQFPEDFDLEVELERKELVELLDRALALLPDETRDVLVERFVRESPMSEIAARLGINAPAAAMRLQRGKLALRRILTTTMRQELVPYIVSVEETNWHETRIWCFVCGQRHLRGRLTEDSMLMLTCPDCSPDPEESFFNTCPQIWGEVKGYGRALTRTLDWIDRYYQPSVAPHTISCYVCGAGLPSNHLAPLGTFTWAGHQLLGYHHRCPACNAESSQPLAGLLLASPVGRRFRQENPRMRILPEQEIELDGYAAMLTRFVSATDRASLEMISARDSGRIVRVVHGSY